MHIIHDNVSIICMAECNLIYCQYIEPNRLIVCTLMTFVHAGFWSTYWLPRKMLMLAPRCIKSIFCTETIEWFGDRIRRCNADRVLSPALTDICDSIQLLDGRSFELALGTTCCRSMQASVRHVAYRCGQVYGMLPITAGKFTACCISMKASVLHACCLNAGNCTACCGPLQASVLHVVSMQASVRHVAGQCRPMYGMLPIQASACTT